MSKDQAEISQTMVYKCPGPHEIHGGRFDFITVDDDKIEDALAEGWHLTTPDAKAAHEAELAEKASQPTRAELEQKAKELGLTFAPNIGDIKLAEKIAEAVKAKG